MKQYLNRIAAATVVLIATTLAASAQNYFCAGTEWLVKKSTGIPGDTGYALDVYSLEETGIENVCRLTVKDVNDSEAETLLYTVAEDNKVYFRKSADDAESYLMYDFDLQPGETGFFWSAGDYVRTKGTLTGYYMKCSGIESVDGYEDVCRMLMTQYEDEELNNPLPADWCWYKGMGAICGPEWNTFMDIVGVECQVCRIIHNGEILLDLKNYDLSGISRLTTDPNGRPDAYYTIDGRMENSPRKGNIYVRSGRNGIEKIKF